MKIKLTENKLKQIVTESVRNVLTELDWRTYASAGKKAHDEVRNKVSSGNINSDDLQNDSKLMRKVRQARKLTDKAVDSSRDKFSKFNDDNNEFYTTVDSDDTYYANVDNDSWGGRSMFTDKNGKTKMQGLTSTKKTGVSPERYFGYNDEKVSNWNNFSKEINDFNSGKSKYIKGKGWE